MIYYVPPPLRKAFLAVSINANDSQLLKFLASDVESNLQQNIMPPPSPGNKHPEGGNVSDVKELQIVAHEDSQVL